MEGNDFVCSSKDCNLRFASETHLKVHKKKHEMVLSLGKTTMSSYDETPTPNTFFRDCEEVGLFQDLRNVNPFEEGFRKAAEAVRTGAQPPISLSFSTLPTDDSLHTPNVFPSVIEPEPTSHTSGRVSPRLNERSLRPEPCDRVVRQEADTSLRVSSPNFIDNGITGKGRNHSINFENRLEQENVQVLLRMPDGTLLELSTKPVATANNVLVEAVGESLVAGAAAASAASKTNSTVILNTQSLPLIQPVVTVQPIPQPIDTSSLVKQKLKQALLNSKGLTSLRPSNSISPQAGTTNNKAAGGNPKRPEPPSAMRRASSSTTSEEDPNDERRKKTLERNRAAAVRCREKRKAFVAELGRKAEVMTATNQALLHEVSSLRAEVTRLKSLLLAHSDCPVTLAAIAANSARMNSKQNEGALGVEGGRPSFQEEEISKKSFECLMGSGGNVRVRELASKRSRLSLDIEGARRAVGGGQPESPLVRSDEVLSSVAPPATPNEADKIITFNSNGDDSDVEVLEERPLATPVIQLNPNAVLRGGTSAVSQGFS